MNELSRAEWAATILDSVADGVFTVDRQWRITSFNKAAEKITRIPGADAIGRPCCEVFRASICEAECVLRQTMETGKPIICRAVEILRADGKRIPISISTALLKNKKGEVIGGVETFRDQSVVEQLRREIAAKYTFADIVSKSPRMQKTLQVLPQIAQTFSTVLITGESGTGKELLARALHNLSPRKKKPFIPVNCGALPDSLLESELFGHVAGAFTDAKRDQPGLFAQAEGGTLFLDEIGDVSPAMQSRLLRVLQERVYQPVGSSKRIKSDVRVICATNKDLEKAVSAGAFRQDLFYRVNVIRLQIPPLRERKEDIPLLVEHFVERLSRLHNPNIQVVSADVMARLMHHNWPGNIRELENAIEHAMVLCSGPTLIAACLPEHLRPTGADSLPLSTTLCDIEARAIYEALRRNGWRRMAAARELGINKTTLWRKVKQLKLKLPESASD